MKYGLPMKFAQDLSDEANLWRQEKQIRRFYSDMWQAVHGAIWSFNSCGKLL